MDMISSVTVLYHECPTSFTVVGSWLSETASLPDLHPLTHISGQTEVQGCCRGPQLPLAQDPVWSHAALSLPVTPAISNALSSSAGFDFS